MSKIPQHLSPGEEQFALHCRAMQLKPEREFRFYPGRRWRFDFAFPAIKLAIEIEGGTWSTGRHTRGSGYEKDLVKYNTAVKLGWHVLRFTTAMVNAGIAINEVVSYIEEI